MAIHRERTLVGGLARAGTLGVALAGLVGAYASVARPWLPVGRVRGGGQRPPAR